MTKTGFFWNLKERKKGQPGCMVGFDKVLLQQQKKQNEKKKILQKRLCQPQLDKEQELEQAVLESSSSSTESEENQFEPEDQDLVPNTITALLHYENEDAKVLYHQSFIIYA